MREKTPAVSASNSTVIGMIGASGIGISTLFLDNDPKFRVALFTASCCTLAFSYAISNTRIGNSDFIMNTLENLYEKTSNKLASWRDFVFQKVEKHNYEREC